MPNRLLLVGLLAGGKWDRMQSISRRVYDPKGLCPTIPVNGGGNHEVKIIQYPRGKNKGGVKDAEVAPSLTASRYQQNVFVGALRGRNPRDPCDRTAGSPTEQRLELRTDGSTNTITTVQKDNVVVEPAGFYLHASEAFQRGPLPGLSRTIRTTKADAAVTYINGEAHVVRKLTPIECWRLFGFADDEFRKAQLALNEKHYKGKDRSSSQLYKQAGNMIVVPVLEAIFGSIKGLQRRQICEKVT